MRRMADEEPGASMDLSADFYKSVLDNLNDAVYFVDANRRILYWNRGAERLTGFPAEEMVGTLCCDSVLMHVDEAGNNLCRSGCPVSRTLRDGQMIEADFFVRHRAGHRIPISTHVAPLRDASGKVIGAVEVFRDNSQKLVAVQRATELQRVALLDPLTGLPNRRYIEMNLAGRFDELERYEWTFGVLFMDIDHFKDINDRYGHDVGDRVLKMVSRTLVHSTRPFDLVGRWGGEEFVGIATNVDFAQLERVANRFRVLVQQSSLNVGDFEIRVTISVGATLAEPGDTGETLVKRADLLMYRSKAAGRNRVTMVGNGG